VPRSVDVIQVLALLPSEGDRQSSVYLHPFQLAIAVRGTLSELRKASKVVTRVVILMPISSDCGESSAGDCWIG